MREEPADAASAAVGVFDSGQGGLSILRELVGIMPAENVVYCSDSGRMPYGPRPLGEVRAFSEQMTRFLMSIPVKIIVIACHAASAASLKHLRSQYHCFPFVGMEPAVKPAAAVSRTGKVGVLATAATFQGELYEDVVSRFAANVEVLQQPCPGLAEFIERRSDDSAGLEAMLLGFVRPLVEAGADNIVLGCSHYPLVKNMIEKIAGDGVTIVDPSPAIARRTRQLLVERDLVAERARGNYRFFTTGDPARLAGAATRFLGIVATADRVKW
ncbi:MAG: glutamate racemase [Planctomycetota bacterium]|jgi:glutamate racemase|nr:glutamate racemase [Planctomycetota bacterium]